ncbi:hypothetical protein V6N13_102227 [Hibiscus sabdariffa]
MIIWAELLSFSPIERSSIRKKMGFIMEFAENLVLRLMEDPKERDRKFREHVYATKDRSVGILRLAKSPAVGTLMMTFFRTAMPPPPKGIEESGAIGEWFGV